jgi:hypothetical protein
MMSTSLQAKRLEAAGQVNGRHAFLTRAAVTAHLGLSRFQPKATPTAPGGPGLAPTLDAIEAMVEAWPRDLGARERWLGWIGRTRSLDGVRRGAFRAATEAPPAPAATTGPDAVEARLAGVAGQISACVVELYSLAGFPLPD